jgi:hypothetical protein
MHYSTHTTVMDSAAYNDWKIANDSYEGVLRELSALRKSAIDANDSTLLYTDIAKDIRDRATEAYLTQHALHKVYMKSLDDAFVPFPTSEPVQEDAVSETDNDKLIDGDLVEEIDDPAAETPDTVEGIEEDSAEVPEAVQDIEKDAAETPEAVQNLETPETVQDTPEEDTKINTSAKEENLVLDEDPDIMARMEIDMAKLNMLTEFSVLSQL